MLPERLSQFGDAWEHYGWYPEFCGIRLGGRFHLLALGKGLAPPETHARLQSVRYRPDPDKGDGSNPYNTGTLTLFWKEPGQLLGPYPSASRRLENGEYWGAPVSLAPTRERALGIERPPA